MKTESARSHPPKAVAAVSHAKAVMRAPIRAEQQVASHRTAEVNQNGRRADSTSITCPCGGHCPRCAGQHLAVASSGNAFEQEADRVSHEVMAAPTHSAVSTAVPRIQRLAGQTISKTDTAPVGADRVLAR